MGEKIDEFLKFSHEIEVPRKPSKHRAFFFLNDLVPWNRFERWRSEEALPRQGWACLSLEDKGCTVSWGLYRATIITGGYRWESTDQKSSSPGSGRISIDLEDTYQIGTITEFLRCRDFAPPSLFQIYRCKQDWRRKRRICGRSNCFWIFFLALEIIGRIEACNWKVW